MTGLRRCSLLAGWATATLGLMVLTGWLLDVEAVTRPTTMAASMKPNAALGFLLTGASILCLRSTASRPSRKLGSGLACTVLLVALLTLVEYVAGWELRFDELLFDDPATVPTSHPGRMAPTTAACFVALGAGLLLVDGRGTWVATALQVGVLLRAIVAVLGYLFGVTSLHTVPELSSMGLHTACGFMVASAGALLLRPERATVLSSTSRGNVVLRRMAFPAAVALVALVAFGYVSHRSQGAGSYASELALSLVGLSSILLVSLVTGRISVSLQEVDEERVEVLAELHLLNRELDERVQARTAALASSAEQVLAVTSTAFDGIVSADPRGVITFANASAARMFGWADGELDGQALTVLVPEHHRDAHRRGFARYLAGGDPRVIGTVAELEGRRQDGTTFPIELSLSTWRLEDRTQFTAIIRDLTGRERADAKFRDLLESAPDAMVEIDSDGLIALVNTRAEELFGYSRDELIGQPVEMLVPEHTRSVHAGHRSGYLAEPAPRMMGAGHDLTARRKDGSDFPVEISLAPIETADGLLVSAAIRDITDRTRAAQAMAASAEDLARSNAELEQFAYVASHDLQEPLRHIAVFVKKLGDRYGEVVDARGQRYIGFVIDGARHMQELIDGLLELSRVGPTQTPLRPVDLDAVVADARRAVSVRVIETDAVVSPATLPHVLGDAKLLYRVFVNLLANAMKFARSDETPRISITAQSAGPGWWDVLVSDNGIGIEPRYRTRAFDIFERLNGDDYPGTGIGLPIVRRILQAHGGRVELTGSEAGGTTVKLTLQACDVPCAGVCSEGPGSSVG